MVPPDDPPENWSELSERRAGPLYESRVERRYANPEAGMILEVSREPDSIESDRCRVEALWEGRWLTLLSGVRYDEALRYAGWFMDEHEA